MTTTAGTSTDTPDDPAGRALEIERQLTDEERFLLILGVFGPHPR